MTIDKIREYIDSNTSKKILFRVNGSRNQIEEFYGIIVAVYKSIFLIRTENGLIKSFSYSDVLIGNIEIVEISM